MKLLGKNDEPPAAKPAEDPKKKEAEAKAAEAKKKEEEEKKKKAEADKAEQAQKVAKLELMMERMMLHSEELEKELLTMHERNVELEETLEAKKEAPAPVLIKKPEAPKKVPIAEVKKMVEKAAIKAAPVKPIKAKDAAKKTSPAEHERKTTIIKEAKKQANKLVINAVRKW